MTLRAKQGNAVECKQTLSLIPEMFLNLGFMKICICGEMWHAFDSGRCIQHRQMYWRVADVFDEGRCITAGRCVCSHSEDLNKWKLSEDIQVSVDGGQDNANIQEGKIQLPFAYVPCQSQALGRREMYKTTYRD